MLSSHSAALSLSCTGWLLHCLLSRRPLVLLSCCPLVLSLFSLCSALLLSHHASWLIHCLFLHRLLVVLSLRRPLVVLHRLVVALPLGAPSSCPLIVLSSCPLVARQLVIAWPPSNNSAATIKLTCHHRHHRCYRHSCYQCCCRVVLWLCCVQDDM
jgi:hypothetical protein